MAVSRLSKAVEGLRGILVRQDIAGLDDGDLVQLYVRRRDEAAFEALVRRHGPMVLGVCRRLLHDAHDAEDTFQAVFLVLVRKASRLRFPGMVGNWLYGVACRTALEARKAAARRRAKEANVPPRTNAPDDDWADLRPVLDHELERLPEKQRAVIVLCDLEGKTRKAAARCLGCPEGTVASRLAHARVRLAKRLARHGFALSGGTLAGLLGQNATANLPGPIVAASVKAAAAFGLGRALPAAISANALTLTEGVLKTMLASKLRAITSVVIITCLAVAFVGAGTNILVRKTLAAQAGDRKIEGVKPVSGADARRTDKGADDARKLFGPIADRFKHRIDVELGSIELEGNARLEILEVWGTKPKFVVGGYYLVHGKYVLPQESGTIYFYETATQLTEGWTGSGPGMDLQRVDVKKGQGEFTLLHFMGGPGYFHLQLHTKDHKVADVYFGTGDTVYRKNDTLRPSPGSLRRD
jgi:RNA polymerase sigma factor (sigma-70 family)